MYYILLGMLIGFIFTTIIFNVIHEETKREVPRGTNERQRQYY